MPTQRGTDFLVLSASLPIIHPVFHSAPVCPRQLTHTECPRSKVGSGGTFAFTWKSEGYNYGAHYWLSDKGRSRRGRLLLWHKAIWWGGWGICCVPDLNSVQPSTRLQSTSEHSDKVLADKTPIVSSSAISRSSISHLRTQQRAADSLERGPTNSSAASPRWRGNILELLYTGRPEPVKHISHCMLAATDFLWGFKITAQLLWVVLFVGGNQNNVLSLLLLWEAESLDPKQVKAKVKCV